MRRIHFDFNNELRPTLPHILYCSTEISTIFVYNSLKTDKFMLFLFPLSFLRHFSETIMSRRVRCGPNYRPEVSHFFFLIFPSRVAGVRERLSSALSSTLFEYSHARGEGKDVARLLFNHFTLETRKSIRRLGKLGGIQLTGERS